MVVARWVVFLVVAVLSLASSAGCAHLNETTRIEPSGEKQVETLFLSEPTTVGVEVRRVRDLRVVEAHFRLCKREVVQITQPQVEVTEKTTTPSAGALAGAGAGALAVGAAVAIFGECQTGDSKCSSGRGAAAVLGAGAFVGLEISALVNGIRSIDSKRDVPPHVQTEPTAKLRCVKKPVQSEEVWAKVDGAQVTLGTLTENGRLILTPAQVDRLAQRQAVIEVGVADAKATLVLEAEHSAQCAALAAEVSTSTDTTSIKEAASRCGDTTHVGLMRARLEEIRRTQTSTVVASSSSQGQSAKSSKSRSTVGIVLECAKDVGAASLCDALVTSVLHVKAPLGHAASGSVCEGLAQALTRGTLDGWDIALAGGRALLFALLGEIGTIAAAGELVLDFGRCLVENHIFE